MPETWPRQESFAHAQAKSFFRRLKVRRRLAVRRRKLEDGWREYVFRVAYDKMFAQELDPTVRFVKAIVYSAQPVIDGAAYRLERLVKARMVRMQRARPGRGRNSRVWSEIVAAMAERAVA